MRTRACLAAAAIVLAVAGCGEKRSHTREDVERAFAGHGFRLVDSAGGPSGAKGAILAPRSREPFIVIVAESDAEAAQGYEDLQAQATKGTYDARRGNVVATSDGGLTPGVRRRITAALDTLAH